MSYEQWELGVPVRVKNEPIWKFTGYRKALYLLDPIWEDTDGRMKDARHRILAAQIVGSTASISANLEERLALIDEIIALLVTELNRQRQKLPLR